MTTSCCPRAFGRRTFLSGILTAGAFAACLGSKKTFALRILDKRGETAKHKFTSDSGMSFKDVFEFSYAGNLIPVLQGLAEEIGRKKLIKLLMKTTAEAGKKEGQALAKQLSNNDLAAYTQNIRQPSRFWRNVLSFEILLDTDNALEAKIIECLWAKTFIEANAADIGYAAICYQDYAGAEGFNPKIKLIRSKTLMQGHDCCNHRFIMEA